MDHVRNLGYIIDSVEKQSTCQQKITSCCYCMILPRVRPCLDTKTAQLITQTLVLSCMDYCNSLQVGTAQCQLDKLQCIQNMGCQIICTLRIYDHISPAMRSL